MIKTRNIITILLSTAIILCLTGCGNENDFMYEKEEPVVIVEQGPSVGYGYVEAQVANDADKDKNLGKKQLVIINGQPIASLVNEYENEFGYNNKTPETKTPETKTPETKDKSNNSKAAELFNLVLSNNDKNIESDDNEGFKKFKQICDDSKYAYFEIDVESMEEQAKTDDSISITNTENVKNIILAFPPDNTDMGFGVYYLDFKNQEDANEAFKTMCSLYEEYDNYTCNSNSMSAVISAGSKLDSGITAQEDIYVKIVLTNDCGIFNLNYSESNTSGRDRVYNDFSIFNIE